MDNLERKLKQYSSQREADQAEIRDVFLEKLKSLDSDRTAAAKTRRWRALPLAAAAAAVMLLAAGLIWFRAPQADGIRDPGQIQAGPDQSIAPDAQPATLESPDPAPPEEKPVPQPDVRKPQSPDVGDPEAAGSVEPDRKEGSAPGTHESAVSPAPGTPGPGAQEDPVQMEPADPKPADPKPAESAEPESQDAPGPPDPADNPDGPGSSDSQDTPSTQPAVPENPDSPAVPPQIGIVYLRSDDSEFLTLTNLSTGESVDVDLTGIVPFYPEDGDSYWDTPVFPANIYRDTCTAFGWEISFQYRRAGDNTLEGKVTGLRSIDGAEKGD